MSTFPCTHWVASHTKADVDKWVNAGDGFTQKESRSEKYPSTLTARAY
jgi:hypothetical protein